MPNQHHANSYQSTTTFFTFLRDNILSFANLMFESNKQQDNITAWLVGMSTGAIALIISQFWKLSPDLYTPLKWSVGFFTGTITMGLCFRIFHLFYQDKEGLDLASTVTWLGSYLEPPITPPEDASAGLIAMCLYDRMGLNIEIDKLSDIDATNDVEYWRNHYNKHIGLNRRFEQLKSNRVLQVMEVFHARVASMEGIPLHKYKQSMKDRKYSGKKKRCLKYICNFCYSAMCISFAVSIFTISYGFITTDFTANPPSASTNQKIIAPGKSVQPIQVDKSE